jgi:steroid delta-isomerase-like uncharacterized protein
MSLEKNMKTIQEVDTATNDRDWDAFAALHTKDITSYSPMSSEPTKGVAAHTEAIKGIYSAFPDLEMTTDKIFGQDEWVFASFTFSGTQKGPLPGPGGKIIPPTNKKIKISIANAMRFENGKIAEEHSYFDRLSMLDQLGINP